MQETLNIHGSMFFLFKKFVIDIYKPAAWNKLIIAAGIKHEYNIHQNYPVVELYALFAEASKLTGLSQDQLKEDFGAHLVPDLLNIYKAYLNPSWKTFELIENTELVMRKAVRKQETNANPPVLNVNRVHDKLLIIDYYSKRKLASLAIGIIKGIASYYKESDKVSIIPSTDPNDERVQIRIEFS